MWELESKSTLGGPEKCPLYSAQETRRPEGLTLGFVTGNWFWHGAKSAAVTA